MTVAGRRARRRTNRRIVGRIMGRGRYRRGGMRRWDSGRARKVPERRQCGRETLLPRVAGFLVHRPSSVDVYVNVMLASGSGPHGGRNDRGRRPAVGLVESGRRSGRRAALPVSLPDTSRRAATRLSSRFAMTDLSTHQTLVYTPRSKVRFVTAASLFDGHDASINIMRRILQASGCEVIHLGHNRSVEEIVTCAIEEDAHGIAVSSYQGGHVEFFTYMLDLLRERGAGHIKVFGGGGGVIVPAEIDALHAYGVTRIFSPEDGQKLGLQGMINEIVAAADVDLAQRIPECIDELRSGDRFARAGALARTITALEAGAAPPAFVEATRAAAAAAKTPVLGITGTGGAGKSSLTDELVRRFRLDQRDRTRIAILSIDPSRRKSGGALLGDRIRMNAIGTPNIYMRSLATRGAGSEISNALPDAIAACRTAGFDLVIVETSGIGQGDAEIVPHVDVSVYVMTPEFGAASQLEKIDMLDFADFVAINKFDRKGAQDALRDVRKQYQRNHTLFNAAPDEMPVYGTIASRFNDDGVTALYQAIVERLRSHGMAMDGGRLANVSTHCSTRQHAIVPASRVRYLAEIAETVRGYHAWADAQARVARERQQLQATKAMLGSDETSAALDRLIAERDARLDP